MRIYFTVLIIYCWSSLNGQNLIEQNTEKKVIQLSGIVISGGDSIHPLHYVNIGVKNTSRGTILQEAQVRILKAFFPCLYIKRIRLYFLLLVIKVPY